MSKTIIIQKNGVAQTLTVDKLRLPDAAGGTKDWLPADGKNLVNLEVKQNGTYRASDFGAYGISEVKVKCTLNGGAATPKATEKLLNALHHPAPAEGGRARTMSAHHLETPQDGGGTVQWVPEEEVALGTKSVNVDNRTYKASDDGKYGYSEFTVSGISITKDGDTITHTDGTGTKTYTLPHHIRVEHGPLKITYHDGEPIDFFDMLVKAYNEDNTVWTDETHPGGVIPLEELILPVTVADYSQASGGYSIATSPLIPGGVAYGSPPIRFGETGTKFVIDGGSYAFVHNNSGNIVSRQQETIYHWEEWGDDPTKRNMISSGMFAFTYDEKTAYYGGWTSPVHADMPCNLPVNRGDFGDAEAAWTILYGASRVITEGLETIPVQWARPWDGEILADSFDIFVTPDTGFGGAEGGGGQTSGGGAGRDN